jgi:hypothetical protein
MVRFLLSKGAKLSAENEVNYSNFLWLLFVVIIGCAQRLRSPLHSLQSISALEAFLEAGIDVNVPDKVLMSSYYLVVAGGNIFV